MVLATMHSLDPMYVGFDVDERTVLRLGRERRAGKGTSALGPGLPVLVGLVDEESFPRHGQVDSVDTRFDPATGTLRCRAAIPNPDELLLPGMFARVRLMTGAPSRAILVPERAVGTNQGQDYVFVVNDRRLVESRPVKLGGHRQGLVVVKEGLKEGEWVVADGVAAVKAGMTARRGGAP
jgi:RND family efflux transporter MFP subunit